MSFLKKRSSPDITKSFSKKGNKLLGDKGEDIAADFLIKSGYTILSRNYSTEVGELDIVATDGAGLVIVEVKTRLSLDFGTPAEAVGAEKIKNIIAVTSQYQSQYLYQDLPVRFDIIEVYEKERAVNHIVNAFTSYLDAKSRTVVLK